MTAATAAENHSPNPAKSQSTALACGFIKVSANSGEIRETRGTHAIVLQTGVHTGLRSDAASVTSRCLIDGVCCLRQDLDIRGPSCTGCFFLRVNR